MKKVIILTLMLLMMSMGVAAQADIAIENIRITSLTPDVSADPCTVVDFSYGLTNIGTFQDTFDLGAEPFGEYAIFSQNPVTLLPGEYREIELSAYADCDVPGEEEVFLLVQSRWSGEVFEAQSILTVENNGIPKIAPGIKKIKVDFGKSFVEIPIENIGGKETTYKIEIEGDDWITVEPSTLTIPARATKTIKLKTDVAEGTAERTYDAIIVATNTATDAEYAKKLNVQVKSPTLMDDLFSIYIHITIGSIVGILLLIFIIYRVRKWLRNTKETRAEKKRLKKEEKDLRKQEKIEKKQLKLQEKIKKKKEKEIAKQLKIKEKEDKKKEKSEAKYEVIKEKARSILTKTFSKEYKLVPRDTEKKPQRTRLWMALIILIIALVGIAFYIKNQLTQYFMYFILGLAIAVALFLLVSLVIHLRRKRLLNKVEQKDLSNLRKEVKEEISVTHNLISKEALKRFKEKRSRKSISTVVILLIIAGVSFAIKDMISEFPYLIVSGVAVGLAVLVIILKIIKSKIKSKKFKEIEFGTLQANKSEVVAVNWKKGLGEFLFRVKNKVESALLSVKLWKNQQVFITPEEKVYQFFEVKKVNIEDKDLDKVSFRFKVKKAWLRRNKIAHEKVSLLRYTTNKWVKQQKLDIINETRNFVFYEAVHSSFSHFAIVGKEMSIKMPAYNKEISSLEKQLKRQKKKTTRKQSYFNMPTVSFSGINKQMIGIILIALAVIWAGMYMVFLVPGTTTTTAADNSLNEITKDVEQLTNEIAGIDTAGGIPAQVTQENQQLSINLGKYFSDPDGDSLTYANSPVEYFTITYEGSTAFITPKPNWAGEEVVVFTATDAKGSSVDSNPVTVKVNEDPNKIKMPQFLKDYGWNLLLGFAVLAIIIALVESRKRMFDE